MTSRQSFRLKTSSEICQQEKRRWKLSPTREMPGLIRSEKKVISLIINTIKAKRVLSENWEDLIACHFNMLNAAVSMRLSFSFWTSVWEKHQEALSVSVYSFHRTLLRSFIEQRMFSNWSRTRWHHLDEIIARSQNKATQRKQTNGSNIPPERCFSGDLRWQSFMRTKLLVSNIT